MPFLPYIYHKNNKQLPGRKVKDKQRAGTDEIRTKSPPSKTKGGNNFNYVKSIYKDSISGKPKGTFFPNRWPPSFLNIINMKVKKQYRN